MTADWLRGREMDIPNNSSLATERGCVAPSPHMNHGQPAGDRGTTRRFNSFVRDYHNGERMPHEFEE